MYATSANAPPTYELGLYLFLDCIMRPPILDYLISSILNQIRHERDGFDIASSVVKGCVDIFLSLQADHSATVYKRSLEPQILDHSLAFYRQEGKHLLNTCDATEFLKRVGPFFFVSVVPLLKVFRWKFASKRRTAGHITIYQVRQHYHSFRS